MILVGTNAGRVYNYNINKKKIDSKFGNCEAFKKIISLDFLDDSKQKFLSVSSTGEILIQNLYNAFDQKEKKLENTILSCSSFSQENNKLFLGEKKGSIFSFDLTTLKKGYYKKFRNNQTKHSKFKLYYDA